MMKKLSSIIKIAMMVTGIVSVIAIHSCTKVVADLERPLPDSVYFHADLIPIFNSNCALSGCHNAATHSANLNLNASTAYLQLFAKHEIDTITPTNSMLYIRMHALSNPMPPTGRLNNYDVALVLKWIQQKAKNN